MKKKEKRRSKPKLKKDGNVRANEMLAHQQHVECP